MHGKQWLEVVAGIIRKENKILLCQRSEDAMHPLQWEFPGGKIKAGENTFQAIKREIFEELSLYVIQGSLLLKHKHSYEEGKIGVNLSFMDIKTSDFNYSNNQFHDVRFVSLDEIITYNLSQADQNCWPLLQNILIHS